MRIPTFDEPSTVDDQFYVSKTVALSWVGHWMYNPYVEGLGQDLILLPMPDFGYGPKTGMGSWNWGITSNCQNPADAWAFIEHLLSPEEILRMTNANGAVPARQSALAQSELYSEDPYTSSYSSSKAIGQSRVPLPRHMPQSPQHLPQL